MHRYVSSRAPSHRSRCTHTQLHMLIPTTTTTTTAIKHKQSVGDCDLNPLTRNVLATPAAVTNLTNLALKVGPALACGRVACGYGGAHTHQAPPQALEPTLNHP